MISNQPTKSDLEIEILRLKQRLADKQYEIENLSNIIIQIAKGKDND